MHPITEIEPCPFCAGPARADLFSDATGVLREQIRPRPALADCVAYVWCHECGAQGPSLDVGALATFENLRDIDASGLRQLAIERWNKHRTLPVTDLDRHKEA